MKIVLIEKKKNIQSEIIAFINCLLDYDFLRICYKNSDVDRTIEKYNPDLILTSVDNRINAKIFNSSFLVRYKQDDLIQSLHYGISWILSSEKNNSMLQIRNFH